MMSFSVNNENLPVTAVISHLVKPGCEREYEKWLQGISVAAEQFEGHCGVSIIRPQDHNYPEYVIILKFNRYANLKNWLESDVRQDWIERSERLVQKPQNLQTLTGLEAWFTLPGKPMPKPPRRYKMATLTWVAVFMLLTILNYVLAPVVGSLPPLLRTAVTSGLVVMLLTYVVMPRVTKLFHKWLYPPEKRI